MFGPKVNANNSNLFQTSNYKPRGQKCVICAEDMYFSPETQTSYCWKGCLKVEDFIDENIKKNNDKSLKDSFLQCLNEHKKVGSISNEGKLNDFANNNNNLAESLENKFNNISALQAIQNLKDFKNAEIWGSGMSPEEIK